MSLGPVEIGLVLLAVMLLFGYRKLPDASRSLGRSLRIFRSEVSVPGDGAADGAAPGPDQEAQPGVVDGPTAAAGR
jgi:sec-independent protein translocase protein TatA